MRWDWAAQFQNGSDCSLVFAGCTDAIAGRTYPTVVIPLQVQAFEVPSRKLKVNEVNTYGNSSYDTSYGALYFGAAELLHCTMQGWMRTPTNSVGRWTPTAEGVKGGTSINCDGYSYADIIAAYIEGRMSISSAKKGTRVDPALFFDPMGNEYVGPKIQTYEFQYTPTPKRVNFNMTLLLETLSP